MDRKRERRGDGMVGNGEDKRWVFIDWQHNVGRLNHYFFNARILKAVID